MAGRRELPRQRPGDAADELRRHAEDRLSELSASPSPLAPEEVAALVHELQVHQIELEMQNDELRRAEHELNRKHEQYVALFDEAPVGYVVANDRGTVVNANLTAAQLLGVERREVIGQPLNAFVFGDDRDALYLSHRALQQSGEPQTVELRLYRAARAQPAPATFWALLESRQRHADGSRPSMTWVTFTDVDERVMAREALRKSEAMRDLAEDIGGTGSYVWDPVARRATLSKGMYRLLDVDPDEFDGDVTPIIGTRIHPEDRETLTRQLTTIAAGTVPAPFDTRIMYRDGTEHIITTSLRAERDVPGRATTIVSCCLDVTEQRRIEDLILTLNDELEERVVSRTAQLEAANKELEAFAYSVSHDLRAPLRAIDGFSQMVADDAGEKLTPVDHEHLQRVRAGAQRMAALIDELLGLSRASRQEMLVEDIDVSAMAAEVLQELREAQPGRQVETVIAPSVRVEADAALLHVILENLLSNAWKFTSKHDKARIEVGVTDADGERAFYVRDDGAGFDAQYATHLFGAFQRMHQAGQFEGDGIGLATVQRLVTRHGGRVWAEAEVEKGATFYFTLPEEATPPDKAPPR